MGREEGCTSTTTIMEGKNIASAGRRKRSKSRISHKSVREVGEDVQQAAAVHDVHAHTSTWLAGM